MAARRANVNRRDDPRLSDGEKIDDASATDM
jgi:hypothetical protein